LLEREGTFQRETLGSLSDCGERSSRARQIVSGWGVPHAVSPLPHRARFLRSSLPSPLTQRLAGSLEAWAQLMAGALEKRR
jgi:hypothetical protein